MSRGDEVWKNNTVAQAFLKGVRGAIPLAGEQIEVMLRLINARQERVESFADLGCGDGMLASAILAQYPHARGTLVDFSPVMIQEARSQFEFHKLEVNFVTADLGAADWVSTIVDMAPFDVIVSGFAIHHQPDQRKRELYGEIFDLLRPGGIFVHIEHVASTSKWLETVFDNFFVDSLFAYHEEMKSGKSREQVADEYYYRPDKAANILSPVDVQCDWLRTSGFKDVDCYLKIFELAVFGGRRP